LITGSDPLTDDVPIQEMSATQAAKTGIQ